MSQLVKKIRTSAGDCQIDYNALANLPTTDTTLGVSGKAADAKIVGDKFDTMATKDYVNTTFSNPNLLINGDFQIWQRGESFSNISNKYTADRWMIKNAKGNTSLVERSTDIPSSEYLRQSIHITETLTENTYLRYNFENALKGTLTLSFWYKTSVAFNSYIYDNSTLVHLGKLTTLNTWTKATFTFTVSSMTFVSIIHAMSVGDCYIAGVKLEYGDIATVLMPRLGAEELALCQRYYIKMQSTYPLMMTQQNVAESYSYMPIPLPASLRVAPTITCNNVKLMRNGVGGNWFDVTSVTCIGFSKMGVTLKLDLLNATYDVGIPYFLILPNSGYIEFDAEIY